MPTGDHLAHFEAGHADTCTVKPTSAHCTKMQLEAARSSAAAPSELEELQSTFHSELLGEGTFGKGRGESVANDAQDS